MTVLASAEPLKSVATLGGFLCVNVFNKNKNLQIKPTSLIFLLKMFGYMIKYFYLCILKKKYHVRN
jgi:hypothetical protein